MAQQQQQQQHHPSSSSSDLLSVPLPHDIDDISNICWSPPDFRYDSEWLMGCAWDGRLFGYTVHDFYVSSNTGDGVARFANALIAERERSASNRVFCEPKFDISMHDMPLLSCEMNRDADVFTGSCDNTAKLTSLERLDKSFQVAQHDQPVTKVKFMSEMNALLTASWDGTCRLWDARVARNSQKPLINLQFAGPVIDVDVKFPVMVVASNLKEVHAFDLRKATTSSRSNFGILRKFSNLLKTNSTCISLFNDRYGFILGSIEGRCAVHHISRDHATHNFAFKCHRDHPRNSIYSISSIDMHPTQGTFSTTGSDGKVCIWDKNSRQRLFQTETQNGMPVRIARFNTSGKLIAFAGCYDWSKGLTSRNKSVALYVKRVKKVDVRSRSIPPYIRTQQQQQQRMGRLTRDE